MDDKILWDIIDGLRDELNIAQDGITDLNDVVKDLQAENKKLQVENIKLNSECWCGGNNDVKAELNALREQELDLIRDKDDLKAEVERYKFHAETRANELVKRGAKLKELQAVNDSYQGEIFKLEADNVRLNDSYIELRKEYNDNYQDLRKENKELQAELSKFQSGNAKEYVDKLKAENKRLVKQVSSNRCNSSSTHTHTISKEIAEYMSHNEGCMGARMFLLPRDEFINDEYDNTIYWDDGME